MHLVIRRDQTNDLADPANHSLARLGNASSIGAREHLENLPIKFATGFTRERNRLIHRSHAGDATGYRVWIALRGTGRFRMCRFRICRFTLCHFTTCQIHNQSKSPSRNRRRCSLSKCSIAYRSAVRGSLRPYFAKKLRSSASSRLPISLSIHPTALWMRSCS